MAATHEGERVHIDRRRGARRSVCWGPCCDGRGRGCLDSRWRIVGADETPGCGATAGLRRAHV